MGKMSIKIKIILMIIILLTTSIVSLSVYSYNVFKDEYVKETLNNQMNFADAKQQGVIRFIDQNTKLAKNLADLSTTINNEAYTNYLVNIVKEDVFNIENHPFADEIRSGKRKINTWKVYHSIDVVENGKIVVSSDVSRVGLNAKSYLNNLGYSDVYEMNGKYYITFSQKIDETKEVQVHADALMLTLIVNGEIGNLAGKMGAFYLAGVGPTMDYYIVNKENFLITDSQVFKDKILINKGSNEPWQKTLTGQNGCHSNGKYETNAGLSTGCREAMGFYTGADGKLKLGASMPFYDSEWTIVVEEDASDVLAPLYQVRNITIIATIILLIVSVLIGIYISKKIVDPLTKLREVVDKITDGDFNVKIPEVNTRDEVRDLTASMEMLMIAFKSSKEENREHEKVKK